MKKRNFCDLGPWAYALSVKKQTIKRHIVNLFAKDKFASVRQDEKLPCVIKSHEGNMIRRGPGIDLTLQQNKAENIRLACRKINGLIILPGESFSFWHYVGKTSRKNGFREGRVIINGKLVAGTGGGLCNLANTIHLLVMHSPLTITELHHHSDALAPDPHGVHTPYSAGTSVNYNYLDFRFRNDTGQPVQLCTYCKDNELKAELRTTKPFPYAYRIVEDSHHFHQEADGQYYRISQIYRETISRTNGQVLKRELKWDNRSKVMFDYSLIPKEQIVPNS